ncbi:hypothetical protein BGZ70_008985 [Mortierella alpina]|uniref:Uncharacterized protein n=1 Tax=Mortierella alpina TaxID=64518 RepID=A0A9P6J2S5_MORAP|nr:hypothetical protein BGZ70_008985 [Mortierella alpina]
MVNKHPHVKLDWKVPEPIKAGSEVLRGVLVISAKELSESEMRNVASQTTQGATAGFASRESGNTIMKNVINVLMHHKRDRMVRIEHIEIDLTGVEGLVNQGFEAGPRLELYAACTLSWAQSPTYNICTVLNDRLSVVHSIQSVVDGYCQLQKGPRGIPFHMRVPEKVGGTFKSAHASLSYQLTANVHIRRGKEVFVLQHHIPVSLFELVQIRTATKVASPHDLNPHPGAGSSSSAPSTTSSLSSTSSCSSASSEGKRTSGVRFVIPKSNSVLGTAAVKPYSLWGLGPVIASSSLSKYPPRYPSARGHGQQQQQQQQHGQRPRTGSLGSATGSSSSSPYSPTSPTGPITRSYSAMTPQQLLHQSEDRDRYSAMFAGRTAPPQEEEMLSVTDQYRRFRRQQQREEQQLQQQQQQQHLHQHHSSTPRHAPLRENVDSVDEVGFGAHIDKSVAAAGDNITLDMFVVKSDIMKVVDIKVSLVETTQIYSLLDNEHGGHGASYPMSTRTAAEKAGQYVPRRRLIETHVNKIARDYVPAQAEESHANDNHLKGYYEDYEDFRTTRSLTMYKLGMRIPESALTIPDRELFNVEYMFVIKFFFKDRIGAFLELPIEIVSQYNHNRISTISGAISCVSNTVQIALPPAPILVKRSESYSSDLGALGGEKNAIPQGAKTAGAEPRRRRSKDSQSVDNAMKFHAGDGSDRKMPNVRAFKAPRKRASFSVVPIRTSSLQSPTCPSREPSAQDLARRHVDVQGKSAERPATTGHYQGAQDIQGKAATSTQEADNCIQASSHVPRSELDAIDSRGMDTRPDPQAEITEMQQIADKEPSLTRLPSSRAKPDALPKIVIENIKPTFALTGSSGDSPTFTTSPEATVGTAPPSPVLPLLFDLTSAALPTSGPSPCSPSPAMNPCSGLLRGRSNSDNTTTRPSSLASPAVKEFSEAWSSANPAGHPPHPYSRLHQRQGSSASRDDDSTHSNNGLVAKLAKSLSSPLLRSRASSPSSPTGSPMGFLNSPQQQSSAFTLAATTLSALTMLSSVGHAAVGHEGSLGRTCSSSVQRHKAQQSPSRPLKSCLKKRCTGLPSGNAMNIAAASAKSDGTAVLFTPPGGILKKKVSFATGSTPLPSPTGSQISLVGLGGVESPHATSFVTANYNPHFSTPPSPSTGGSAGADQNGGKLSKLATATPVIPASSISHSPTIQSPVSASPRSRFHHPFDSHPSRLSPLEKQHLDYQIQDLNVPHSQTESDGEDDDETSADEEDMEEDEDEGEDYEGEFEDEDDAERETEEQRIERRRLARVAWLAKYGDAFKQVYGAVPELPPI